MGGGCLSPKTFTPSKNGYTFTGWREDNTASSDILSEKVMGDSPINLYAIFSKTITLSYNGNGATSGSTASQSGNQYYNNGNYNNPSFSLRSCGFSRTNYSFVNWRMGSASGTAYNAGASVTLSSNTVFYAMWTAIYASVSSATVSGNVTLTREDNKQIWPYASGINKNSNMSGYSRSTLASNACIQWNGNYFNIIAKCPCTVTITGSLALFGVDRGAQHLCELYTNNSFNRTIFDLYISRLTGGTGTVNVTVNLSAGQTLKIMCSGGNDNDSKARARFNGTLTIKATANI